MVIFARRNVRLCHLRDGSWRVAIRLADRRSLCFDYAERAHAQQAYDGLAAARWHHEQPPVRYYAVNKE